MGNDLRAKGLGFDEVAPLLNERREALGSGDTDRRRLHYVAITRAKKLATVIRVG
jgi:superfamily I DNA/RNA helicase